jgi:hypothetical protein
MFQPYAVKVASTVLIGKGSCEVPDLLGSIQIINN